MSNHSNSFSPKKTTYTSGPNQHNEFVVALFFPALFNSRELLRFACNTESRFFGGHFPNNLRRGLVRLPGSL